MKFEQQMFEFHGVAATLRALNALYVMVKAMPF